MLHNVVPLPSTGATEPNSDDFDDSDESENDNEDRHSDSAVDIEFGEDDEEVNDDVFGEENENNVRDKKRARAAQNSDSDDVDVEDRVGGLSDCEYDSDSLQSKDSDSDAEVKTVKHPRYKELKDMSQFKWEVGTIFGSKKEFQNAVKTYAVHSGKALKFVKNDKFRCKAICKGGDLESADGEKKKCPCEAYVTQLTGEKTWQLRVCNTKHTCSRALDVKMMSSKWLAKRIEKKLRQNPKMRVAAIQQLTREKWNCNLARSTALRAKKRAMTGIRGSYTE